MALEYQLFGERILVKKIDETVETKTPGGIIIPNSAVEREERNKTIFHAEVESVGPDVKNTEKGDIVVFNISGSQKIFLNDEEFYMLPENNLIAKVVPTKTEG